MRRSGPPPRGGARREGSRGRRPGPDQRGPRRPFHPPEPRVPPPPPPGAKLAGIEELEVVVEKLVAGGEGLARCEGVPLFVPRSAPGDRLRVRIVERHADYGRAEIVAILAPGPARRPDPYPELSPAGVCDLQHLDDRAQAGLKASAARETIERLGHLVLPADAQVVAGEPWHYRLRTQVHTGPDPVTGEIRVGYHARGSNELVPLSQCALLVPELEALFADLPRFLGPGSPRRLDLAAGDGGAVTVSPVVEGLPHGEVTTAVGDFTYAYDARCFFQGHRGLLARLVECVVGPWQGARAVDLYGGAGLFALPLAARYARVELVESDAAAVRYARLNARRNRLANVEVVAQAVETWVSRLAPGTDRVVVDPPRSGLTPRVRKALLTARPRRLTYVSCHPAALARDLRQFASAFRIESAAFFDLFPQTGHLETVLQLVAVD